MLRRIDGHGPRTSKGDVAVLDDQACAALDPEQDFVAGRQFGFAVERRQFEIAALNDQKAGGKDGDYWVFIEGVDWQTSERDESYRV